MDFNIIFCKVIAFIYKKKKTLIMHKNHTHS